MLEFNHPAIDWCQVCALPFADYWCVLKDDHIVPFVFERKAKSDFFGSFGGRYENEKKKLIKSKDAEMFYKIAIECPMSEVLSGYPHSTVDGLSLIRTVFTWGERYGVETIFCDGRKDMANYIAERFYAYGKEYAEKNKNRVKIRLAH